MTVDMKEAARRIERAGETLQRVREEVGRAVVGQRPMVDRLLVGLLTGGHVLLEGVPGLAKTLAVKSLADALAIRFRRIQFTPDLLPADLTGTLIYNPRDGSFTAKRGPLFANLVLADEINRAPAKVQSALLEAMQERQVTLGDESHRLEEPFLVHGHPEPHRAGGDVPAARGADRPLHAQGPDRLSRARGGEGDPAARGTRRAAGARAPGRARGRAGGAGRAGRGLRGRQDPGVRPRPRDRHPAAARFRPPAGEPHRLRRLAPRHAVPGARRAGAGAARRRGPTCCPRT